PARFCRSNRPRPPPSLHYRSFSSIHRPMSPVCLITGASMGIGAALAREIADDGYPEPVVIPSDLSTPAGVTALENAVAARGLEPAFVVNNAGFGLHGDAATLDRDKQLAMIDLNVRALTDLSLRFIDGVKRQRGGILNVASVTEALHGELAADGVRVCALCPGPVETEFFGVAGLPDDYFPEYFARSAERVAREGYELFMAGHRVVVPGTPNRIMTLLPRFLPRALLLGITGRRWRRANRGGG